MLWRPGSKISRITFSPVIPDTTFLQILIWKGKSVIRDPSRHNTGVGQTDKWISDRKARLPEIGQFSGSPNVRDDGKE
jgi:hypothetical protein